MINKVVADSFDGRSFHEGFASYLIKDREIAKENEETRQIYAWWQGDGWEKVVALDTEAILKYVYEDIPLFNKDISTLKTPILFIASQEDELLRDNIEEEYKEIIQLVPEGSMHIFSKGGHPAILTNAEEISDIIKDFLSD